MLLLAGCESSTVSPRADLGPARDGPTVDTAPARELGPRDSKPGPGDLPTKPPDQRLLPDAPPLPPNGPKTLPKATKPCPKFIDGDVFFLGVKVRIWVNAQAAASKHGPLIFYWHGTGSSPLELALGLPGPEIAAITAQGGIVAAPYGPTGRTGVDTGGIVWKSGDIDLADEIVACAYAQLQIDPRRIHSMGMSAGGLHTTQMTYVRAGYLASVVSYSGGLIPFLPAPPLQDPTNKIPAMIFHGGVNDNLFGYSFKDSSQRFLDDLKAKGHFAFMCDHGGGHWLPAGGGAGSWRFFQDHPFGTHPSPYAGGLPSGIPSYCFL